MNLAMVVEQANEQVSVFTTQPQRTEQPHTADQHPAQCTLVPALPSLQVLPAVYLFVGRSLNATPVQLGTLTLCRAMVQVGPHGSPAPHQHRAPAHHLQMVPSASSGRAD